MQTSQTIHKQIQDLIVLKNYSDAINFIEKNKKDISEKDYWYFLSICHRYKGEHNQALVFLNKLIVVSPSYGRGFQEFGHNYVKIKNQSMALKSYLRAVKLNSSLHASWLGILTLDNVDSSILELADKNVIYLKNLPPELKSVLSFINEGKLKKADSLCRGYLQKNSHHIEAMRLLALIARDLHVYNDSEFLLESCLVFDPTNTQVSLDYINILIKRQKYKEALEEAKKLYDKDQNNLSFMVTYAVTLQQTNNQKDALDLYKKILEINGSNSEIIVSEGHLHKTFGNPDKAINSYKKAYQVDRLYGDAYWSLANLKTYKFSDQEITSLEKMVKDEYVNDEEKVFMNFALGKAYEDRDDYKNSFKYYKNGNDFKKANSKFNSNDFKIECQNQKEVCTEDLLSTKESWGLSSVDPIFILGLPRVGSTLLEQILASHSQVEATHELPNILAIAHKLNQRKAHDLDSRYPDILLSLSAPQLKLIGEQYINDSEVFRSGRKFFIDKMPNNFRHIGLIKLILPNAKIIDIRRNSMSACFSCYKQLFAEGQEFTYDLKDLGSYYNNYVDLMDHWNKVLPNKILSMNYEDVVNNFESSVKEILDYCELPFEKECLEFYKSNRSVRTPSSEQVRQPIYKSGMDYWKNYESYLDELKSELRY